MKRILGWRLMVVFLASLCLGGAACSHSHKDPGSSENTSKKHEGSDSNSGYGY